jgi:hypothetical protein
MTSKTLRYILGEVLLFLGVGVAADEGYRGGEFEAGVHHWLWWTAHLGDVMVFLGWGLTLMFWFKARTCEKERNEFFRRHLA